MRKYSDYINLYAAYRGDRFVDVGTIEELADRLNYTLKSIYTMISRCNHSRIGKLDISYVGKEIKPMYERLMQRLNDMRKTEHAAAVKVKKEESRTIHLAKEECIRDIMRMVNILKEEEERYIQAEQEGRYYQ